MEPLEPPVKEEGETQEEGSPQNKEQTLFLCDNNASFGINIKMSRKYSKSTIEYSIIIAYLFCLDVIK